MLTNQEKQCAMVCHLSALSGFVGVPFGNILGPLLTWLFKRNEYPFVDSQGKEALNFHFSLWIYGIIAVGLHFTIILIPLAWLIGGFVYFGGIIYTVLAALSASNGVPYYYPCTIRFFR